MWTAIIAWILLFLFLVIAHEFWHFLAAKKSGTKPLEFGIWIPPRAFKYYEDKDWTEYTINWIPLGGFVRLKWEDPDDPEVFYAKDSFITQSIWKKLFILVAWVWVNLFIAWAFFSYVFWQWTTPINIVPEGMTEISTQSYLMPNRDFLDQQWYLSGEIENIPIQVEEVMPESVAYEAGIQTGDVITHIGDEEVKTKSLGNKLQEKIWEEFEISLERNWEQLTKQAECWPNNCLLGIIMKQEWEIEVLPIQYPIHKAMVAWAEEIYAQTRLTFHVLWRITWMLLTFDSEKARQAAENVAWPVGAVKVGEMILEEYWFLHYIAFGGMISLALAIFNILPLPALDGWRAIWAVIQSVGRIKPENYFVIENYFNFLFFVLLMLLWVYIIFLDLARFWWVDPFGM